MVFSFWLLFLWFYLNLKFFEDSFCESTESDYPEPEVIKEFYLSDGVEIALQLGYLNEDTSEIRVKRYH